MSDVFLLSPWCERKYFSPQYSLLFLKYYLHDHAYEAKIIDCSHYDYNYKQILKIIKGKNSKPIIGITAYTRERFHAYRLIEKIKEAIPESLIVVGGRHFGFLAEETLTELSGVDIVVRGEGEITMKEICDMVSKGITIDSILGISYRKNGNIQHNAERPFENNLDLFRSFDLSDTEEAQKHTMVSNSKVDAKNEYFSVMATRGCPNKCIYCSLSATKVRFRSIESIIQEIEEKIFLTGMRNVSFLDSSLTINRSFVENLCNRIIEKKLNIRINCYSRVNIELDVLKLMKKAGLVSVEIGLETGSPKVLKSIRKNINIDQFRKFCKEAHGLGIKIYVFCMMSLPDETIEDVDMTISLVEELAQYIYHVGMQTTRVLPDTALYAMAKNRKLIASDFNWFKPYQFPDELKTLTKDPMYESIPLYIEHLNAEVIKKKHEAFESIVHSKFSNFNVLLKTIKQNLSSEGLKNLEAKTLIKKGVRFISMTYYSLKNKNKENNYLR